MPDEHFLLGLLRMLEEDRGEACVQCGKPAWPDDGSSRCDACVGMKNEG